MFDMHESNASAAGIVLVAAAAAGGHELRDFEVSLSMKRVGGVVK
jgi:hypothetical protein